MHSDVEFVSEIACGSRAQRQSLLATKRSGQCECAHEGLSGQSDSIFRRSTSSRRRRLINKRCQRSSDSLASTFVQTSILIVLSALIANNFDEMERKQTHLLNRFYSTFLRTVIAVYVYC